MLLLLEQFSQTDDKSGAQVVGKLGRVFKTFKLKADEAVALAMQELASALVALGRQVKGLCQRWIRAHGCDEGVQTLLAGTTSTFPSS